MLMPNKSAISRRAGAGRPKQAFRHASCLSLCDVPASVSP